MISESHRNQSSAYKCYFKSKVFILLFLPTIYIYIYIPLHKWIRECKPILKSQKAKAIGEKIQIGYKQPRNLQRLVGGYRVGSGGDQNSIPPDAGCKKCKKCKVACPILEETKTFRSTNTGKVYKIKQSVTCTSAWVIYLSTCKKCKGQYVGKSKTIFKLRHSNHKMEIKNEKGVLATTMEVGVAAVMPTSPLQ